MVTRTELTHATNGSNGATPLVGQEPIDWPSLHTGPATLSIEASRQATGIARLDELLGGGLPRGRAVILYGPAYTGKVKIAHSFLVEGFRSRGAGTYVTTDATAPEIARQFEALEPRMADHELEDRAHYIDAYSAMIGESLNRPNTTYVSDLLNVDELFHAIEDRAARLAGTAASHRLVFDTLSSLVLEAGAKRIFHHLRHLNGQLKRTGATALLLLDDGMHPTEEVETVKHLSGGMIHTRKHDDMFWLRAEGFPDVPQTDWLEYAFTADRFEVAGGAAPTRRAHLP